MGSFLDLPNELHREIFCEMRERELLALATVCSAFRPHAEAMLYTVVNLIHPSCHWDRVISWCRTVSSTPRKAQRVRVLRFPHSFSDLPPSLASSLEEIEELFKAAFACIINLQHLSFPQLNEGFEPTVKLSTLSGCRFRLSSLGHETTALVGVHMEQFLSTQPDILFWSPNNDFLDSCRSPLPQTILPNLRTLFIGVIAKLSLLKGRPIEYLFTTARGASKLEHFSVLRNISSTLHTLYYLNLSKWPDVDFISLCDDMVVRIAVTPRAEQQRLVEAAASLPRLKVLVLSACMEVLFDVPPAENNPEAAVTRPVEWIEVLSGPKLHLRQCLRVVGTFMQACPNLTRLSVPAHVQGGMMTFLRSNTNSDEAIFDGSYAIEDPRWWDAYALREIRGARF
ncbi:hypothetical protein H0H81_002751 [Sphagnurus paluster]|uniref:F-box domain-containing protein n=1 Tax=Sphagnurus paluster TaxID=117069 RepID=A0A9P7GQY9_9AGAR|nr:hypothetical protein H0H81_002751 [Sphagnurus paluster]